jgi:hypothetical protein
VLVLGRQLKYIAEKKSFGKREMIATKRLQKLGKSAKQYIREQKNTYELHSTSRRFYLHHLMPSNRNEGRWR